MSIKRIAILGSTGSIGRQTLDVIRDSADLDVCALAAGENWELLSRQAQQFAPQAVSLSNIDQAHSLRNALGQDTPVLTGSDAMCKLVETVKPDILLSGVVGAAGLAPTLEAIKHNASLAIANKETLVMAGAVIMPAVQQAGLSLLPVDSEHSAIFQCLASGKRSEVRSVTITASGGALRDMDDQTAAEATVDQALAHPTWEMGKKITIDSATMMNKALEVVEAHWLFNLSTDEINVVQHDESIVHSYVEYCDGSVIAQMGQPDMTTPIAYALHWPDRPVRKNGPLDLAAVGSLNFAPLAPRFQRAVDLGFEAITRGGLAGAVLNGANESAVQAFLEGNIRFGQIVELVEMVLKYTPAVDEITLEALIQADRWARGQVTEQIGL
ncbi:MAG: 1-deoxy-D-xylulose-5-phosphate reductoisomerase [Phycisphaerae bacterium]|nr:1-deoxy-D-xylulose-5-phosphate reductoisomerase [Phycisphaerae bacterium]